MRIEDITCLPRKSDGTILIKTEVDHPQDNLEYCFYIYKGSERIYTSPYQRKNFILYTAKAYGKYQIKAFVRAADKSARTESVTSYVVTRDNAKDLQAAQIRSEMRIHLYEGLASERVILAEVQGSREVGDHYAWYVYQVGRDEPVFKSPYSGNPMFAYQTNRPGSYYLKVFCTRKQDKWSLKSDQIKL